MNAVDQFQAIAPKGEAQTRVCRSRSSRPKFMRCKYFQSLAANQIGRRVAAESMSAAGSAASAGSAAAVMPAAARPIGAWPVRAAARRAGPVMAAVPARPVMGRTMVNMAGCAPAMPAYGAAPADPPPPGVAAPVPAGSIPTTRIPAKLASAPDKLGLLDLRGAVAVRERAQIDHWRRRGGGHAACCDTRHYRDSSGDRFPSRHVFSPCLGLGGGSSVHSLDGAPMLCLRCRPSLLYEWCEMNGR
jgi:hypothetical protein